MNAEFRRVKEIFLAAVEKQDAAECDAYVREACGQDEDLRRQVDALLSKYAQAGSFLEPPAPSPAVTVAEPPALEQPGTLLGPYKVLEQIGEGGFGVVFLAEQTQPVRRKVALKILKPGMATRQIVARFEQERQALALMDHPNIAKVFDGGTTPSRRPYFVMELVKGIPITEFCDQHHLTVRQRLELFISVCQAVQHAHQKGIIHRDLKPANVLVSRHDTTPVVKVIDFGVAKALGQELTENTLFTGIAQIIGTPLYMSPEQAGMSDLDVDTRSDIYSLGVLLYELLTGTTPFTKERFKQAGYDEMRRIIGEEEPPRPSTRLSEATESRSSLSAQRQLELAKLTKLVRGELDWIVMKCLEKDRNRRYETANALALDVQRYLADEPVQACPPSLRYRFGKFARRNKAAVGIAAMIVVAALTVLAGALWHNRQLAAKIKEVEEQRTAARREAGRADANFAKTLEAVDKFLSRMGQQRLARIPGMERVRREVLEEALQFFQGFLQQKGDEPAVRWEAARAYFRVGHIQNLLGRHRAAEQSYRRATELLGQLTSAFPAEAAYHGLAASCQTNLAILLKETGRYGEAERAFQRAVELEEELLRQHPGSPSHRRSLARSYSDLAVMLKVAGRLEQAEKHFGRALEMQEKLAADAPTDVENRENLARSHQNYGLLLKITGRLAEGERAYRRAVELYDKLVADTPAHEGHRFGLCGALLNLGVVQETTERPKEAEAAFRRAVELAGKLAADFPAVPDYRSILARSLLNLAARLQGSGRLEEGERAYRRVLELHEKLADEFPRVPEYRRDLAGCLNNLGALLYNTQRLPAAEAPLRRALALRRELAADPSALPGDRSQLATAHYNLANLLKDLDQHPEAEDAYREARRQFEKLVSEFPQTIDHRHVLGAVLNNLSRYPRGRGDLAESRALLERAIEHQSIALRSNPQHPRYREYLANHYRSLVEILIRQAEHGEAARIAAEAPRLFPTRWQECVRAAEYFSRCVPLAEKDARLPEDLRRTQAQVYADQAMTWLRDAAAKGCKDLGQRTRSAAFDPLRGRADFQKLVQDWEAGPTQQPPP